MDESKSPAAPLASLLTAMVGVQLQVLLHLHSRGVLNKNDVAVELEGLAREFAKDGDKNAEGLIHHVVRGLREAEGVIK